MEYRVSSIGEIDAERLGGPEARLNRKLQRGRVGTAYRPSWLALFPAANQQPHPTKMGTKKPRMGRGWGDKNLGG